MTQETRGLFDFEGLSRCPVCEKPTVSRLARWKLYLGAKERCGNCMAGWRFVWGKWLYHLPIFVVFLLEIAIFSALEIVIDPFVVLVAVALPVILVPIFLPLAARLGDRLTDRSVRRQARETAESDPPG